jgi:4-amino-4-deoxy-L-arabinose transferase-like glycosyltransferase
MFLALSGAVSNDPLLIAACTWVLALCAKGVRNGWTWKLVIATGLLTGVALLTKTTAIALLPALLVAALVPQKGRPKLAMAAGLAVIALILVAPWWVRNQQLYGDPLAIKAFNQAFTGSAQKDSIVGMIGASGDPNPEMTYWKDWVGWWTARSFIGVFGYMDIWLNESGRAVSATDRNALYRLVMAVFGLAFLGWLLAFGKSEYKSATPMQAVNAVFLVLVVLSFVRFNMQYFQAQGRYILPALGPIACGMGLGLTVLFKNKPLYAFAFIALLLLGINGYALSVIPGEFDKREHMILKR